MQGEWAAEGVAGMGTGPVVTGEWEKDLWNEFEIFSISHAHTHTHKLVSSLSFQKD